MILCCVFSALAIIGMIASVITEAKIFKKIPLYFVITTFFAILIIACGLIPLKQVGKSLVNSSAVNPIKILVLFISMTALSVFLDEVGFFKVLANFTLKKAGKSQIKLFVLLYIVVSILTVFTSNDIIVLTFTPFICYFCKNAKIDPIPFLIEEFVASNTFSMMMLIGNPTNIYLSLYKGLNFVEYLKVMWLSALFGGVVAFVILFLLFYKKLKTPIVESVQEVVDCNKPLMIIGIILLAICTLLLVIADFIKIQMWLISLCFAVGLFVIIGVYKLIKREFKGEVKATIYRLPYGLIPFLLSMFIIVSALDYNGVTETLAKLLAQKEETFTFGISAFLGCNVLNNIPMSVLFSNIPAMEDTILFNKAIYSIIIGSNIGAFLTPIGALAGIMFTDLVNRQNIKYSFISFVKYGLIISIPTILTALFTLELFI